MHSSCVALHCRGDKHLKQIPWDAVWFPCTVRGDARVNDKKWWRQNNAGTCGTCWGWGGVRPYQSCWRSVQRQRLSERLGTGRPEVCSRCRQEIWQCSGSRCLADSWLTDPSWCTAPQHTPASLQENHAQQIFEKTVICSSVELKVNVYTFYI